MYTYLKGTSKDCGSPNCIATLANSSSSVLSWFGGSMPPGGTTSDAQATSDVNAWAAAGALDN